MKFAVRGAAGAAEVRAPDAHAEVESTVLAGFRILDFSLPK
jgi:hypothetical protein